MLNNFHVLPAIINSKVAEVLKIVGDSVWFRRENEEEVSKFESMSSSKRKKK